MKTISIKNQKKILYIPIFNVVLLFHFVYISLVFKIKRTLYFKTIFQMFVYTFPIFFMYAIINEYVEPGFIVAISIFFTAYFVPLIFGKVIIFFQIKNDINTKSKLD